MNVTDVVGERGEMICLLALTEFHNGGPLFTAKFLGDKWPAVDILIEVADPPGVTRRSFFFAQVKTTRTGYQRNGRLKIPAVASAKVRALSSYAVPAYLLGVDEVRERVYIVAVQGNIGGMSSMSAEHELNAGRRVRLRDEVQQFWQAQSLVGWTSAFPEANWGTVP